jgi:hypothetical protein
MTISSQIPNLFYKNSHFDISRPKEYNVAVKKISPDASFFVRKTKNCRTVAPGKEEK